MTYISATFINGHLFAYVPVGTSGVRLIEVMPDNPDYALVLALAGVAS